VINLNSVFNLGAPFGVGIVLAIISWFCLYNYHTIQSVDNVLGLIITWWVVMLLYSAFEFFTDGWNGIRCVFALWPIGVWALFMFGTSSVGWSIALSLVVGCMVAISISLGLAKLLKLLR
jgi:hypothetical protein